MTKFLLLISMKGIYIMNQPIIPIGQISIFSDFDLTNKHNGSIVPNKKYYIRINDIDKYDNCKILGIAYNDDVVFKYITSGVFSFIYKNNKNIDLKKEISIIILVYGENNYKSKLFTLQIGKEKEENI